MNEVLDIETLYIEVATRDEDIAASFKDKLIPTEPSVWPGNSLDGFHWEQYLLLEGSKLDIYTLDVV